MGERGSSSAAGGSGSKAESINDMLQHLGIEEEEFDDLVFEEEEEAPKEGLKWMALARVHTSNFFSPQTFEQHMRALLEKFNSNTLKVTSSRFNVCV
jgi:hypothetical protein